MRVNFLLQSAFAAVSLLPTNAHPIGYYPRDDEPTISSTPCGPAWTQQAYKNGVVVSRNGINYKSLIFIKETDAAPGVSSWKWGSIGACRGTEPTPADPSEESTLPAAAGAETTPQINTGVSDSLPTAAPDDTVPNVGSFYSVTPQEFEIYQPPVPQLADQCAPLWTQKQYALNETVSWGSHNYNSVQPISETDTQGPGMDETKWTLVGPCLNGTMPLLSDMPSNSTFPVGDSLPDIAPGSELDTSLIIPVVSQADNATTDAASITPGLETIKTEVGVPSVVADVETTSSGPIGVKAASLETIKLMPGVSEGGQAGEEDMLLSESVSNVTEIGTTATDATPIIPEVATTNVTSVEPEVGQAAQKSASVTQLIPDGSNANTTELNASLIAQELVPVKIVSTDPEIIQPILNAPNAKDTGVVNTTGTSPEPSQLSPAITSVDSAVDQLAPVAAELEVNPITPNIAELDNKAIEQTLLPHSVIDSPVVGSSAAENLALTTPETATAQATSTINGASVPAATVTPAEVETTQFVPLDIKISHAVKGSSSLPQPEQPAIDPSVDAAKVDHSQTMPDPLSLSFDDTSQSKAKVDMFKNPDIANQPLRGSVYPDESASVDNSQPGTAGASSGNAVVNSNPAAPEIMAPQFVSDGDTVNAVPEPVPQGSIDDVQPVGNVEHKAVNSAIPVKAASGRLKRKPTVKKVKHWKKKPKWTRKQKKGKYTKRPKRPTMTKPHTKPLLPKTTQKTNL
ncbi:hypothetical protein HDU81_005542 [Chytriomyces hyalinus]|nr:hypothetical protein HDU81_005542 [Chytriomyces hyalinus]